MSFFRRAASAGGGQELSPQVREALAGIAGKMSSAIVMVDRDFIITYVNPATTELLRKNAAAFQRILPSVDPEKIIGSRLNIDLFHNNIDEFRKIISDISRLPYETEITVGDLKIQVLTNASFDRKGVHVGNVFEWRDVTAARLNEGIVDAVNRAQGIVEYSLDGTIQQANNKFLKTLEYTIDEIKGRHHSMFVDPAERQLIGYHQLWEKLARGEFDADGYKRISKAGKEVWIRASYNPVFDATGKPFKVVEFAIDITENRMATANFQGQIAAISKAQAVIEFTLDGKILTANDNFCAMLGYSLSEIQGKHQSLFVDATDRQSPEYQTFWDKLGRGGYESGKYKRIGKGGKEIWIQANYNPIMDLNGRPFKVVKFATDITAQVEAAGILQKVANRVIAAVKENDLTQRIPLDGMTGEVASLCAGVNALIDTMTGVIAEIKASSREVASASAEISASTTNLSQRTEEQAASLEETSASMEEISITVKKNAENAQEAKGFANGTRDVAGRGGKVVASAVQAMSRIEESSRKISDIIGVIDEIARQTNLLALNAAVEAARAGDAGRGFAVVASEVRSLAQRSSQAAKDIKDLITNSNSQVKDGVDLVNRAGTALGEIVESIKKVADIVTDIAAASAEQSTGLEQVNKALLQMDEVTQQNSALVEENAATARTLEQQAKAMDDQVSGFRLDESSGAQRAPAPTANVRRVSPARPRVTTARPAAGRRPFGGTQTQGNLVIAVEDDPEWKEF